jgi:sulfite reductase alpha subunit-like flavoprotein
MAKDVEHAIINLAVKFGDRANEEAGREWFKDMKHHGRYMEDVW